MINEGIESGTDIECEDTALKDLKLFQDFLHQNFKDHEKYNKLRLVIDQLAKLFATVKTHKFDNLEDISSH